MNQNDTVSTEEIEFGDNDTLSAVVTAVVEGDLLILLTDIDGLYTDDPHRNKRAKLISEVPVITEEIENMARSCDEGRNRRHGHKDRGCKHRNRLRGRYGHSKQQRFK